MMKVGPELKNLDLFSHKKQQITALKAPCAPKALSVTSHTSTQRLITLGLEESQPTQNLTLGSNRKVDTSENRALLLEALESSRSSLPQV